MHRSRNPYLAFGAIWLAAVLFLAATGRWQWVGRAAGEAAGLAVFVWLTVRVTRGRPQPGVTAGATNAGGAAGWRLRAQLAGALALAALAVVRYHDIPVWIDVMRVAYRVGEALPGSNPDWVMNPLLYVVLPGALVLALGARWREIGFGEGWRSWRAIAAWSAPVVGVWAYSLATGRTGVGRILKALASNAVLNGFSEEFLWRGVIQTRIRRLWTPEWGLVLASLGFGLWHIDSITDWAGNDLWLAAALNVVIQAPMGLALGVVFDRTRNLLAPSVIHAVVNSVDV